MSDDVAGAAWLGPGRGQLTVSQSEARKPGGLGTACARRFRVRSLRLELKVNAREGFVQQAQPSAMAPASRSLPCCGDSRGEAAALSSNFPRVIGAMRENNEREECR